MQYASQGPPPSICPLAFAQAPYPALPQVNDWLQTRTYLVGGSLTLADLVVFGTVHPATVSVYPGPSPWHSFNHRSG